MQATVMVRCSLLASILWQRAAPSIGVGVVSISQHHRPGDPVWIWTKRVEKWRAVVITQDSVSHTVRNVPQVRRVGVASRLR